MDSVSYGRGVALMLSGDGACVDRGCSGKRLFDTLNDVRD